MQGKTRILKKARNRGKIFILSGPSGSGKTTLHNKLLKSRRLKGKLIKSISMTTRPRRSGEVNGRDYFFTSKKKFFEKRSAGHFLEWKKVFDNYYGTPKRNVERTLKTGKSILLCIDVKGANAVRRRKKGAIGIFVKKCGITDKIKWPAGYQQHTGGH